MSVKSEGLVYATFTGRNGSGSISVPGLKVGDIVLSIINSTNNSLYGLSNEYEGLITVDDQIQQLTSSDQTSNTWQAVLFRQT